MKYLPEFDWKMIYWMIGAVVFFCLWSVFVWFGWNGFLVPQFSLRHLSYSAAGGCTVLCFLLFVFCLGLKELKN